MPERLPSELRALYGLARSAAGGTQGPGIVLDRLCAEIHELFGFASVRVIPCTDALAQRATSERRALVEGDVVVVPLLADDRTVACAVGEGIGELAERDLQLLTALGLLAGILVEKAERDVQLEHALSELRRADELKSEFVSTASHELRAPVAVVFGIASTLHLRGDDLTPEQLRDLRTALYAQTGRLRDLTEQLLDLSRIESGTLHIRPERFRPREWIDALLLRTAPDRREDVEVDVPPELELETDPSAFERVVGNLVANALRYGRPPVLVRGSGGTTFCLAVEDRGDGVAEEFVPDLFGRFTRSDDSRARHRLGAGLGLSIARSFAEALGGVLHYEPAEPHGARFVLELPEALPLDRERAGADFRPSTPARASEA